MAQTKAPSGLSISRSGNWFTLWWKIADSDYADGQWFSYLIDDVGADNWSDAVKIGTKTTSKGISINPNSYYPRTNNYLYSVSMRVKGNRKKYKKKGKNINPTTSAWSGKQFDILAPVVPALSVEYDEELTNRCVFSWSYNGGDAATDNAHFFTDIEWQTILVKNTTQIDGSKLAWNAGQLGWGTGTSGVTGSRVMTEDTSYLYKNGDSYARWFRVRARGPRGASNWNYSFRVYAIPHQAKITRISASETKEGGFQCMVDWIADSNRQYPIDKTTAQYTIVKPEREMMCPSGANWTDADISADTGGGDAAVFSIDDQLSEDQCLFIRINTHHDKKITYGKPTLAASGYLKDPENLSVDPDGETYRVTVNVTNRSEIEDSVLAVRYVPSKGDPIIVGIIPYGDNEIIVQCPDWSDLESYAFDVFAMVGTYIKQERSDGVDAYTVDFIMRSKLTLSQGGVVPVAPKNVTVSRVESLQDTVRVTWDWTWKSANGAEISWSDHDDAWESTDQPEYYTISNMKASRWNISGLELGKRWYVRVRLFVGNPDDQGGVTYGPWSNIEAGTIDLSAAPNKPSLQLSTSVIPEDGSVTASWVYTTIDNTAQIYAEIAEVILADTELPPAEAGEADMIVHDDIDNIDTPIRKDRDYSKIIAHALTAQHVTIDALASGWEKGKTYNLACRVKSASGRQSEWSDVVSVTVADPMTCEIVQDSLVLQTVEETVIDVETGEESTIIREFWSLIDMPMTVTVEGAGVSGVTSVEIERAASYHIDRPDEDEFNGYEGETIATQSQNGEAQMTFDLNRVIGSLDDGAKYRIVATTKDGLGQSAKTTKDFEVHWDHQANVPSVVIELDKENLIAKITPIAPENVDPTDVADIYRLSIDKPELILKGAQFGVTYVDPYPALGDMGGHRVVLRTKNGDYITPENTLAMIDSNDQEDTDYFENEEQLSIIDFEGKQIKFYYDTDYSNTWAKDFQETQYLGGSIQGDWNAAVSRSGTLSSQAITVLDQEMLQDVRRLATYSGVCHVRTPDGSSYAADVQVSENRVHDDQEMLANYSLSITRVGSQGYEGMTLEQWNDENPVEPSEEEQ